MMGDFSWLLFHQRFHWPQTRSLPTAHLQVVPFVLQLARYNPCTCTLPVRSQAGLLSRTVDPSGTGRCTFRPPVLLVSGVSALKFVGDLKMTQEGDEYGRVFQLSPKTFLDVCY